MIKFPTREKGTNRLNNVKKVYYLMDWNRNWRGFIDACANGYRVSIDTGLPPHITKGEAYRIHKRAEELSGLKIILRERGFGPNWGTWDIVIPYYYGDEKNISWQGEMTKD